MRQMVDIHKSEFIVRQKACQTGFLKVFLPSFFHIPDTQSNELAHAYSIVCTVPDSLYFGI